MGEKRIRHGRQRWLENSLGHVCPVALPKRGVSLTYHGRLNLVPKRGIYWPWHRRSKVNRSNILPGFLGGSLRLSLVGVGGMDVRRRKNISWVYGGTILVAFSQIYV